MESGAFVVECLTLKMSERQTRCQVMLRISETNFTLMAEAEVEIIGHIFAGLLKVANNLSSAGSTAASKRDIEAWQFLIATPISNGLKKLGGQRSILFDELEAR